MFPVQVFERRTEQEHYTRAAFRSAIYFQSLPKELACKAGRLRLGQSGSAAENNRIIEKIGLKPYDGAMIKTIGLSRLFVLVIFLVPGLFASAARADSNSLSTLTEAFAAAGFDPQAAGCFTFVATSDIHYGTSQSIKPTIDELNAMAVPPRFFVITGDLVTHASVHFGNVPNEAQRAKAIAAFGTPEEGSFASQPGHPAEAG